MAQPQSYNQFLNKYQPHRKGASLLSFALIFGLVFFLLQWTYQGLADTEVYRFYIEQLTVRPSAFIIQLIAPQDHLVGSGHRLVWPGGR